MPDLELRAYSGLDRGAFQPLLAAGTAWLLASETQQTAKRLTELLVKVFPERIPSPYVRRFAAVRPSLGSDLAGEKAENAATIDNALLEAGSALRKILVTLNTEMEFKEDEDFDADPVYSRSVGLLDLLRPQVDGLASFELCQCPHCSLIGELHGWFGMRVIDNKPVRQSWCRVCRTLHPPSPE